MGKGVIEPLSKLRILDVGCGAGLLSEPLARLGAEVTGIDAVKENVECAQQHSSKDLLGKNEEKQINLLSKLL